METAFEALILRNTQLVKSLCENGLSNAYVQPVSRATDL